MSITRTEALRQQRRIVVVTGVLLGLQLLNTLILWQISGRFPVWAGIATTGMAVFTYFALVRYRHLQALPPEPAQKPGKKRRRLRDPHRQKQ